MKTNNKQIVTYLAYGIGAVILYKVVNNVLQSLGLKKTDTEQKNTQASEDARKKELEQAKKKSSLTRPESSFYSAADTIEKSLNRSSIDDDADAAQYAFTNVINSLADLSFLKYVYGVRPLFNFGLKVGDFDLISTLQREFSSSRYAQTVDILKKKGVNL